MFVTFKRKTNLSFLPFDLVDTMQTKIALIALD